MNPNLMKQLSVRVSTAISKPSSLRCRPTQASLRTYYSEYHPDPPPFPQIQDSILSSALKHVPTLGFSPKALTLGAQDAGYLEVSVQLFPRGIYDLINYHLVTQRLALKKNVQFDPDTNLGVGQKVKILTMERLKANKDIIPRWQEALGYMSLLGNIPASLKELNALSDEIWYLAGDTSVDFSWYTKRASLAMIYATSEVFMTTDKSPDFAATSDFLDRRLEDVQKVGGTIGGVGQYASFMASSSIGLARSWGMRV